MKLFSGSLVQIAGTVYEVRTNEGYDTDLLSVMWEWKAIPISEGGCYIENMADARSQEGALADAAECLEKLGGVVLDANVWVWKGRMLHTRVGMGPEGSREWEINGPLHCRAGFNTDEEAAQDLVRFLLEIGAKRHGIIEEQLK